jgi:Glutamine amidotransferase domain/Asparagine synthase
MPGLCGFVAGEKYISDLRDKLRYFNDVQHIPGIKSVKQSWYGSRCTILNCQTGLLPDASEHHAQDNQKKVHLFFEGEVYNRDHLLDLADVFHPSDRKRHNAGEAMLRLFLREGTSFVRHLRGEFAVAIYEEGPHRLHLFTDHLATKSIYYFTDHEGFLFGSEKKSILSASTSTVSIDPVGLLQVFALTHNLSDQTFISQIRCLTPASYLLFEDGKVVIYKYWHVNFNIPKHRSAIIQLRDQWGELLTRAVSKRVQGKDRLILFLSGGLDSRAVACALPRDLRPLIARTRGDNNSLDVQYASAIAYRLGFNHYVEQPTRVPLSEILEHVVWRTECGVPFTYCLSIADHHYIAERADFIIGGQFGDVGSGAHIKPYMLVPQSRKVFLSSVFRQYLTNPLPKLKKIFTDDFLDQVFPRFYESFLASFEEINPQNSNVQIYEIWDMIHRQPRLTLNTQKVDSHRFEAIFPLLDFDYLEFALALPFSLRFGQALYQTMIWALGPEIRHIPYAKTGRLLSPWPSVSWVNQSLYYKDRIIERFREWRNPNFRNKLERAPYLQLDARLEDFIELYLSSTDFEPSIFDAAKIRALLKEHYKYGTDHESLISILATFAVGLPLFLRKRLRECPFRFDF